MKTKYFLHSVRSAIQNLLQAKSITPAKKKGETAIRRHWGIRKSGKIFALNPTSVGLSTPLRKGIGLKKKERIELGTCVISLALRHSVHQEQILTVSNLPISHGTCHIRLSSTLPLEDRKANIWYGRDASRNFELNIKDKMATTNPASKKA